MPDNRRHTEFFGPDLARGPVLSGSPQTAAVQLATALAQLRAPLSRSDDALREHADFIRELSDRLMPDWAALVKLDVGELLSGSIQMTIRTPVGEPGLLHCWLADAPGGGITSTAPTTVTWDTGIVLQTIVANKHYLLLTPDTGTAAVTVSYGVTRAWYWGVARYGRAYFSGKLQF